MSGTPKASEASKIGEATNVSRTSKTSEASKIGGASNANGAFRPSAASRTYEQRFTWPPLSVEGEEEIRLFRLQRLGDDSKKMPSEWSLETFLFSRSPPYNALSYTWADPSTDPSTNPSTLITRRTEEVKVNSKHLKITTNLADFLRHLEKDPLERWTYFWIDAISIDQENVEERSLLVQRMKRVYERASQVIIWLGSDRLNVAKMFASGVKGLAEVQENLGDNAIPEIPEAGCSWMEPNSGNAETGGPPEEDGSAIFKHPWWTRAWIIQEASTPTKNDPRIVHLDGLALKRVSTEHVVWIGKQRFTFDQLVEVAWFFHEENRGISGVKSALELQMVQKGRQKQGRQKRPRRLDLYDLLPMVRRYDCADARDKIYSVLAIADDYRPGDLRPDYSKPVTQIYTSLVRYLIERDRCLDILGFCSAQRNLTDLPSWVPDWTYKDVPVSLLNLERQHRRRARFNACGRMGYFVQFRNWESSIRCYGLEVDKVTNIGPLRSQDYESFYNQLSSDEKKKMDELSNPRRDQRPRYRTSQPNPASLPDPEMVAEAHLIREATMHRRLIWTRRGYVGLAPADVQIDCIICVLAGCRVPLVLQRAPSDYKLIGECYILGIMAGEVERGSNVERDAVEYNIW
jgi:Heterokaryon incompatibility protein (HET)